MDGTIFTPLPSDGKAINAVDAVVNGQLQGLCCGVYATPAAGETVAALGTATMPMLLNPANSGRVIRIMDVSLGVHSVTTLILGHLCYGFANFNPGGGWTYSAGTPTAVGVNKGFLGSQAAIAPCGLWFVAGLTLNAAPTYFCPSGYSSPGAFAAGPMFPLKDWIGGAIALYPGEAFFPIASDNALTLVCSCRVLTSESPLPTGA